MLLEQTPVALYYLTDQCQPKIFTKNTILQCEQKRAVFKSSNQFDWMFTLKTSVLMAFLKTKSHFPFRVFTETDAPQPNTKRLTQTDDREREKNQYMPNDIESEYYIFRPYAQTTTNTNMLGRLSACCTL